MKLNKLFMTGIMAFSLVLASCGGGESKMEEKKSPDSESAPPNADQAKEMKLAVDTEKSVVKWRGHILGIKEHTGTLKFKDGSIKAKGDEITGGGLTVDMSTMVATDDNFDEEHPKEGLIGHLSSPDFFDVASFPLASVVFKGGNEVSLSIRDKSNVEQFTDMEVKDVDGKKVYTAKLEFDRQAYGVAYSGSKDAVISDKIELEVELYAL